MMSTFLHLHFTFSIFQFRPNIIRLKTLFNIYLTTRNKNLNQFPTGLRVCEACEVRAVRKNQILAECLSFDPLILTKMYYSLYIKLGKFTLFQLFQSFINRS